MMREVRLGGAFAFAGGLGVLGCLAPWCYGEPVKTRSDEGIAVAIVYDTSGSMKEPVPAGAGGATPKWMVANRALRAIVDRIESFAKTAPAEGERRKIEASLVVFDRNNGREAIPFGPFDPRAFHGWIKQFSSPGGATPLGDAIRIAGEGALKSPLNRKHVVILTDGMNTAGPDPAKVIGQLKKQAERNQALVSFHFVAFDVNASVFEPAKKLGATVVGANDEKQLNTQLEFIFAQKILLEDEDAPPAPKSK